MPPSESVLSKDRGIARLPRGRLQVAKLALAVRAIRHALGLSQAELVSLAKCARPTIHRLELGLGMTLLDTVEALVAVFRARGVVCGSRYLDVDPERLRPKAIPND